MWGGSLGLLLYYWQQGDPAADLLTFLKSVPIYNLDPEIIWPTRLPMAVAGALFIPFFYRLVLRLFGTDTALVAALLVALHPFHIALSRVLHHDALNTTFMVLSGLALAGYWLQGWRWPWLPASGVLAGLAFLSKQVSWFLLPFVGVLAGWTLLYRWQRSRMAADREFSFWPAGGRLVGEGLVWAVAAGLAFVAFFPAMWVIPVETLKTIFSASTRLAGEGHTHYFLGQVSKDPGALFYLVGWLLRATPFEVIGLLGLAGAVGSSLVRPRGLRQQLLRRPVWLALALFVGLLWLFLSVSDKKMVRYALPAFPVLDLFAALGLIWLVSRLKGLFNSALRFQPVAVGLLVGLIVVGQGWLVLRHHPYYLTYHNPLFGGTPIAARLMTIIGWGEGLHEAADYLNQQPAAESLQVVAERFCSMLRPFFVGQVSCLNSSLGGLMQADYMVYYYNVLQRDLAWPDQWRYFARHRSPAHRVNLQGLDYVLIYRNPIEHQVDREANRWPGRFAALGYNLSPDGHLTLFWQNRSEARQLLLVGVAPTDGVYPAGGAAVHATDSRQWVRCSLDPAFAAEAGTPGAILESDCSLGSVDLPPGLYDLQLGLAGDNRVRPVKSARLGVIQIDRSGAVKPVRVVKG
jgi:4-amino-4-deoxy-L-arabinose transferase-like glycosyltransferase